MKIQKLSAQGVPVPHEQDGGTRAEKAAKPFSLDLNQVRDEQSKERLNALLQEIDKQGAKLGQAPTYSELKKYRDLVRSFVSETVGRMYDLQSQPGWDRQGRQKMYTTIRKIDETLADLTEEVRQGQQRQMQIMDKHDAIRGLLVDLYT